MGSVRELVPVRHHSPQGRPHAVHSDGHHGGRGSPGTDNQEHHDAPRVFTNTDNTAAETKHITCFVWAAYLVGVVQNVDSVAFGQGQVGHTHS